MTPSKRMLSTTSLIANHCVSITAGTCTLPGAVGPCSGALGGGSYSAAERIARNLDQRARDAAAAAAAAAANPHELQVASLASQVDPIP